MLLLTVLLSGCRTHEAAAPPADYYYLNPDKRLTSVGRVAVVELENDSSYPQMSADITGSLFRALEPTYTLDQLSAIHEKLKCDGILVGTITEFRPYPHMAVGLRLKLLDLRDGQLLWALEQIWDSADKTVEKRTKNYFESEKREGFAPLREQLTAVSPLEFIKFVSYEVAETL
ncbi:MAG: hypothetical protein ACYSUD_02410 [Planctomycetota bacterium]